MVIHENMIIQEKMVIQKKMVIQEIIQLKMYSLQACKLLTGLITTKDEKEGSSTTREVYERLYIFTLMWSIGAFLELDDRAKMEEFLRKHETIKLDLPVIPDGVDATMFDYMVDADGNYSSLLFFRIFTDVDKDS